MSPADMKEETRITCPVLLSEIIARARRPACRADGTVSGAKTRQMNRAVAAILFVLRRFLNRDGGRLSSPSSGPHHWMLCIQF